MVVNKIRVTIKRTMKILRYFVIFVKIKCLTFSILEGSGELVQPFITVVTNDEILKK
jgi:hypothetical protein